MPLILKLAIGHDPKPVQSSTHPVSVRFSLILSSLLFLGLQVAAFQEVSPTKFSVFFTLTKKTLINSDKQMI
jgi:hypothetical protein